MTVTYAGIEIKSAYLSTDFGRDLALKRTGLSEDKLAELVGRYKRGPRKGKLKGKISWSKVVSSGWVRTGAYNHDCGHGTGFVCPFTGICFGFGISRQEFRQEEVWLWGNSPFDTHVLWELSELVEKRVEYLRTLKKDKPA